MGFNSLSEDITDSLSCFNGKQNAITHGVELSPRRNASFLRHHWFPLYLSEGIANSLSCSNGNRKCHNTRSRALATKECIYLAPPRVFISHSEGIADSLSCCNGKRNAIPHLVELFFVPGVSQSRAEQISKPEGLGGWRAAL